MIWIFTPKIWMRNENLRHFAKWKRSSQTLKFSQVLVQKSAHANFTFFKAEMRHLGWKNDNASLQRNLRCSCVFVCNSQENLRKIIRQSVTGSSWIFNHVQNPGAERGARRSKTRRARKWWEIDWLFFDTKGKVNVCKLESNWNLARTKTLDTYACNHEYHFI